MTTNQQTHTSNLTLTGHLRADYILSRFERAIIRAHGRVAFERWRTILADEAVTIARSSKRPGLVHRLIEFEKRYVEIVGECSPESWEYGQAPRRERRRIRIEERIRPGDPLVLRRIEDADRMASLANSQPRAPRHLKLARSQ